MKKYMKTILSVITLGATMSLFAADTNAVVDTACIFEIRPCDKDGNSIAHPMSSWPKGAALDASQPLYFNVRLIVPDSNNGPYTTRNEFSLAYVGSTWPKGSDNWWNDYARDRLGAPLKLGIFVNGALTYATIEDGFPKRTPSRNGGDSYDLYDLVFKYVPKTGDFSLPIRLAVWEGGKAVPAPENYDTETVAPTTAYVFQNDNKWSIRYSVTQTGREHPVRDYKANMTFIDATSTESYFVDSPDYGDEMNSNYSLKGCGFFVKTVDFEDNDAEHTEWEDSTYWKSVKKGGTSTFYLEALGPVVTNLTSSLWVWSDNESVMKIAGGVLKKDVIVGYKDGGATPIKKDITMAEVTFQPGSQISSGFRVTGVESNLTANLTLSGFDGYSFNVSGLGGVMITNFVTVPVRVTAPAPCSLTLSRISDVNTYNVTSNYAERLTQMKLVLSEAYTNEMRVTVAPVLKTPGPYLTNQIVRVNNENEPDGWVKDDPITITFDKGETVKKIDVYGMGADKNYTVGTGHEIQFKIASIEPAAAADFVKSQTDAAAFLYFKPAAPVALTPAQGEEFTFVGGEPRELYFTVADNYTDMLDTGTGYKVYWKKDKNDTGKDDKKGFSLLKDAEGNDQLWRPDADGILRAFVDGAMTDTVPAVTYEDEVEGEQSFFYIVAPNGEKSANTTVIAHYKEPAAPPTVRPVALNIDAQNPYVEEGTNVSVKVQLSEPYSKKTAVYAFLRLADTNLYAKMRTTNNMAVEGARSYLTVRGGATESMTHSFIIDDGAEAGTEFEFEAVLCTSQIFSTNNVVKTFKCDETLYVNAFNIQPTVQGVRMNNFYTTKMLEDGTYWIEQAVAPGVPVTFDVKKLFTEPSEKDVKAAGTDPDDRFRTRFRFQEDGSETIMYGNPNSTNITHTFSSETGVSKVQVSMMDKDMMAAGGEEAYGEEFEFVITHSSKPTISVLPIDAKSSFYEDKEDSKEYDPDNRSFTVTFSQPPTVKQTLKLTVASNDPASSKPGKFWLTGMNLEKTGTDEYELTVPSGRAESTINVYKTDGTTTSADGFIVDVEVITVGRDPATKVDWKDYYLTQAGTFKVYNSAPRVWVPSLDMQSEYLQGSCSYQNAQSNAYLVGASKDTEIKWRASDIEFDFDKQQYGSELTVTWTVGGVDQPAVKVDSSTTFPQVFKPDFSGKSGLVTVTINVEDKDSGVTRASWYYRVETSKSLTTYAHGPRGSSGASASTRYQNEAKGLGKGRTYTDATFANASGWSINWNCGLSKLVECYAWGYKVGDVDDGSLGDGVKDVELDANGNNPMAVTSPLFYTYDDPSRDSFFYRWIAVKVAEEASANSAFMSIAPEKPLAGASSMTLEMPTEEDKEGGYTPSKIEAVFSKEWLPADNLGDINFDGVPDAYVAAYKFGIIGDKTTATVYAGGTTVGESTTEGAITGDDLARLDTYNEDGDYLPNFGSAAFAHFIPALSNTWVSEGRAFTAALEIRGWGTNLNDAVEKPYVKVANAKPDMIYEDPATCPTSTLTRLEWDAYVQAGKPKGWSPERPTDPTMLDTDDDGLPDGYEYYIWYKAHVGYMDNDTDSFDVSKGVHKYLTGRRFNPFDPFNPTEITPAEIAAKFDPLTPLGEDYDTMDTDWDGIPDAVEFLIGTNPMDYDTDGDGLPDGYEVVFTKTDPLKTDTNDNGKTDDAENDDNDTMATIDVSMNFLAVVGTNTTEFYCYPGNPLVAGARSQASTGTVFRAGSQNYLTTKACRVYTNTANQVCLGVNLSKDDTWACGTSGDKLVRGEAKALSFGTVLGSATDAGLLPHKAEFYDSVLTKVPEKCYVAWRYGGAETFARGRSVDPGVVTNKPVVATVANKSIKFLHYHVYQTKPFDPRTGWFHPPTQGSIDSVGFTHMDEFLTMVFWYNAGQIPAGKMIPTATRPMTTIWTEFTTNPLNADSDNDRMPDGWELYLMADQARVNAKGDLKPAAEAGPTSVYSPLFDFNQIGDGATRDNDGDAIEWPAEYSGTTSSARYGWQQIHPQWRNKAMPTNPWDKDTDGDGVLDGYEGGINPPGTTQWEAEIVKNNFMYNTSGPAGGGLNPLSWDTDKDGLPDPWEIEFHGTYKAGSTQEITYEQFTDPKSTAVGVNATTVTVTQVVGVGASWNMDGMDGTVPDERLDYDSDGLANWQEYLVGAMRCWRYDDIWSGWGLHENTFRTASDLQKGEAVPAVLMPDPGTPEWNQWWYERLLDKNNFKGNYNPHLANGYFDPGVYFSCCTNAFDTVKGRYYMFRDGVYHNLASAKTSPAVAWVGKEPEMEYLYDYTMYPQQYICCDPTKYDTDYDGMDDYYELFHGLNPLLGEPDVINTHPEGVDRAYDVVFDAYARLRDSHIYDPNGPSALNNWWRNDINPHRRAVTKYGDGYDFIAHPWLNGIAGADPDGDNIVNQEESIMPNVQAASTYHHSDPTPLWMTDSSYTNSLTRRYYLLMGYTGYEDTSSWSTYESLAKFRDPNTGKAYNLADFPGFSAADGVVTFAYSINQWDGNGWAFSFEENEGYDSDHDFLSDFEEAQGKTKSASNMLDHDSPLRRQAMYFCGKDNPSFLQTPIAEEEQVPNIPARSEARQNFLYYTVECWAKPDKDVLTTVDGSLYTLVQRTVWADYSGPADERLLRRNFMIGIRDGKWYTCFDGSGTDAKQTVEITDGVQATTNWTHVAATFDGKQLKLYVNGTRQGSVKDTGIQPEHGLLALAVEKAGEMNPSGGSQFVSGSCITLTIGASPITARGITYDHAWRGRSYLNVSDENPLGLASQARFDRDYGNYYKGYIDEVRIWDGARSAYDIGQDCENRVRYTAKLAAENREAVFAQWTLGGLRSPASPHQLPAQLMYHYAFDHVAGAILPEDVIRVPAGFDTDWNVTDAKARWVRPADWVESCWANSAVRSTVYSDPTWVPWINNTVSHLPRFDLTTLDSVYWSENYAGDTSAVSNGYTSFSFPRSNEVYSRWTQQTYGIDRYYDSHYDYDFSRYNLNQTITTTYSYTQKTRWNAVTGYAHVAETNETGIVLGDLTQRLRFAARDRNTVGDDILPMGGAYPRRIGLDEGGMWDSREGEAAKAADAWAQTGTDADNNGLPDWWEEYARANYCEELPPETPLDRETPVTYFGVSMPAWKAYEFDLIHGMVKIGDYIGFPEDKNGNRIYGDTRDTDGDGLPDWWEEFNGLDPLVADGEGDADNDGLSNRAEYLGYKKTGMDFNAQNIYSVKPNVLDYFIKTADGKYVGESLDADGNSLITDHDFMEDAWEDMWDPSDIFPYTLYANRYVYDANLDADEDGWKNWSECRAYHWGCGYFSDIIDTFIGGDYYSQLRCFPRPAIGLHMTYNGRLDSSWKSLIVRTRTANSTYPDAIFQIDAMTPGSDSDVGGMEMTQIIGVYNNMPIMRGFLNPGLIVPASVKFEMTRVDCELTYYWHCTKCPRGSGSYLDYKADIDEHGEATKGNGQGVTLDATKQDWKIFATAKGGSDGRHGVIYKVIGDDLNDEGTVYGTIDYRTGEFSIDLKALSEATGYSFDGMAIRANYTYNLGAYWPQTIWLNTPEKGYVKEGENTVEAFLDLNEDGKYDVGEPYGRVNVNVGWHKVPEVRLELGDGCDNGFPLFEIQSSDDQYDEEQSTVGKGQITDGALKAATLNIATAQITSAGDGNSAAVSSFTLTPNAVGKGRLRVVRTAINGASLIFNRTVMAKTVDVTYGRVFTVADFIPEGQVDLDSKFLVADAAAAGIPAREIKAVDYSVYWGNDDSELLYSFTRTFDITPAAPALGAMYENSYYKLLKAQPELTWVGREGYGAFVVQVSEDKNFGAVLYAATNILPAASTTGYTFKPDLYVGEELKDQATYYWRVAQLNAKFTTNVWSKVASFSTAVDSKNLNTGYGKLAAEVRYYGPSDVAVSNVIVGVYEAGDFCCAPVARARLVGDSPICSLTNEFDRAFMSIATNVVFDGIAPGEYYVMAFADKNGNGVRDAYESWGYVCKIGTEELDLWTPVAITVTSSMATIPRVLVVMEDTDVNQNMKPDCLEDETGWGAVDTDGDGISDDEEQTLYGTDPFLADTDGDGLSDFEELFETFTDPKEVDTDGDGMDDGREFALGSNPCEADADTDFDHDGLTNLQECQALDDLGLALRADKLMTDGETPDYFRVGTKSVKYAGEFYNGAEWIEPETRDRFDATTLSRAGTRYATDDTSVGRCIPNGWDLWSHGQYYNVGGVGEALYSALVSTNIMSEAEFNKLYLNRYISIFSPSYQDAVARLRANPTNGVAVLYYPTDGNQDYFRPDPYISMKLRYPGNGDRTIILEAYQTSMSYPEMGEQMTARWSVKCTFRNGMASGVVNKDQLLEGGLVQGPARFYAYIAGKEKTDVNSAQAAAYGYAECNVGFAGGEIEITLGTPNQALPVIELASSNGVVQSVAIVRTAVNGKKLDTPRGVYVNYFQNNVARQRLYPTDFVTGTFIGVDKFLAADYDQDELERIYSVEYAVVDGKDRPYDYETWSTNTITTIKMAYSEKRDKATVNAISDALQSTGTLSFNVPTDTVNSKFWLRYAKEGGQVKTLGGATGFVMPCTADGTVKIQLADYISNLTVGTYTFSVALGNDKFGHPAAGDFCAAVRQYIGADAARDAGFTVTLKHPTAKAADFAPGQFVVAAYESADLAEPVATTWGSYNKAIRLDGLRAGKGYYLAAWYVANPNDGRTHDEYRQPYDTWGYVASLGSNVTCFAACAVKALADAGSTNVVWLQDTDFNDNDIVDRLENATAKGSMTAPTSSDNEAPAIDADADFDWDYVPDDLDPDPVFPIDDDDPVDWVDGDVMAYAEVPMLLVELSDGTYALAEPTAAIAAGQEAARHELWSTYDYAGRYGLGTGIAVEEGVKVVDVSAVDVALVHAQVYDRFGFNPKTAVAAADAVNTKAFTARDKFMLTRYFTAIGVADPDDLVFGLLQADTRDYDGDQIPDGWELYVMFGPNGAGSAATLSDAAISPWNPADAQDVSPGDANLPADAQTKLYEEFDEREDGAHPTDPWKADTDGDNVIDRYYHDYMLWDPGSDSDDDGLSRYAEYLISKVFKFADLDVTKQKSNGSCVDYFRKPEGGELYVGEMFTDHDQVDDQWEQGHADFANRYVYDPSLDDDGDGWSNWAESKAGTHPGAVASPGVGYVQSEYPVPAVAARVVYSGTKQLSGPLVFQAWSQKSDPGMTGTPDAIWTVDGSATTNVTRYVGVNPGKKCSYYLGTGSISPGTVCIRFRDMGYETATVVGETVTGSNSVETGYAKWYPVVVDNGSGDLYTSVSNTTRTKVGTVDYATGLAVVDFGCDVLQGSAIDRAVNGESGSLTAKKHSGAYSNADLIDLSRSYVKIEWTPVKVSSTGNATYYLSAATGGKGFLREGLNKFVVFCDNITTDGKYTPGEPFGFVGDVDVGWQGGSFAVQLTETSPVFARIDLRTAASSSSATGGSKGGTKTSDREVWQEGNSTVLDVSGDKYEGLRKKMGIVCEIDGEDLDLSTTRSTRVRVVRVLVDGEATLGLDKNRHDVPVKGYYDNKEVGVVMDKYFDLDVRSYIHEGDFLTDGAFDIDWAQAQEEVYGRTVYATEDSVDYDSPNFVDPTNITYAIVVGEGALSSSNLAFRCVVTRVYDSVGARYKISNGNCALNTIRPVIDPAQPQDYVYGARPTFRWAMQDGNGANYDSYTAFKLQILDGNGAVVYDSDYRTLPPRDATGWYGWTLDEPIGSVVPASGNFRWRVSLYDAKFRDDTFWDKKSDFYEYLNGGDGLSTATWSESGTFTVNMNNQQAMNDHGYSSIAAAVKYAGPSAVLAKLDAAGTNTVGRCLLQAFETADFAGAPMGQSYVTNKAEIANTAHNTANAVVKGLPQNGTYYLRAFIDSNGNGVKDDFESWGAAKEPVTLTAGVVTLPRVGIYIEDADTDGDWLPDAWEYAEAGWTGDWNDVMPKKTGKIAGGDKIRFSATIGTAGISTGLGGASLTIFQDTQALIEIGVGGSTESIDAIRKAVEKKVDPNTVKITALTLAPDGKSVTLSVAAEVTDSVAGQLLGKVYDLDSVCGDTKKAKVTVRVFKKENLATAEWTEACSQVAYVGQGDVQVSVPVSGVDMKGGFYKIEIEQ